MNAIFLLGSWVTINAQAQLHRNRILGHFQSLLAARGLANTGKMNELNNGTKGPAKRQTIPRSHVRLMYNNDLIKTSRRDAIQPLEFPDPGPRTESHLPLLVGGNHYMAGPYQLRRPLPPTDARLVNYVFLGGRETSNAEDMQVLYDEISYMLVSKYHLTIFTICSTRMAQCGE